MTTLAVDPTNVHLIESSSLKVSSNAKGMFELKCEENTGTKWFAKYSETSVPPCPSNIPKTETPSLLISNSTRYLSY